MKSRNLFRDNLKQVQPLLIAFLAVAVLPFVLLSLLNWLAWQDTAFYQRPTVTASTAHALKRSLGVIMHPAASMPDSWEPMLHALKIFSSNLGGTIYEQVFFRDGIRFQYPPSSLLVVDFLALFSAARLEVLAALNIIWLFVFCCANGLIAARCFSQEALISPRGAVSFLVGFGAGFLFYPVLHAVNLGQVQIWIDAAFALSVLAWLYDKRALSGALIGLTCMFKPQAGIFLLWAAAARDWRFVQGFLFAALPVAAMSLLRYGLQNHFAYLDVLSFLSRHSESFYANNSLSGILHRLAGNGVNLIWQPGAFPGYVWWIHWVGVLWAAILYLSLLARSFLSKETAGIVAFSTAAAVSVIAAPVAWEHHYGILLSFFVPLLKVLLDAKAPSHVAALLAAAWIFLANYMPVSSRLADSVLNPLQANFFLGGLLFLSCLLLMRRLPSEHSKLHKSGAVAA